MNATDLAANVASEQATGAAIEETFAASLAKAAGDVFTPSYFVGVAGAILAGVTTAVAVKTLAPVAEGLVAPAIEAGYDAVVSASSAVATAASDSWNWTTSWFTSSPAAPATPAANQPPTIDGAAVPMA